jgi:hypothetical protein
MFLKDELLFVSFTIERQEFWTTYSALLGTLLSKSEKAVWTDCNVLNVTSAPNNPRLLKSANYSSSSSSSMFSSNSSSSSSSSNSYYYYHL